MHFCILQVLGLLLFIIAARENKYTCCHLDPVWGEWSSFYLLLSDLPTGSTRSCSEPYAAPDTQTSPWFLITPVTGASLGFLL